MQLDDKISIVLPVYNSGKYIIDTINSLKKQLYKNIEINIIDGSTDNTHDFIINTISSDARFKYYQIKNRGPGYSRNIGIRKSSGVFITFIDHDDIVSNDWILSLYSIIKKYEADVSFCFFKQFDDEGHEEFYFFKNIERNSYELSVPIRDALSPILIAPWTKLARRDIILKYNIHFSKFNYFDDVLYHFLILQYAKKIAFCHRALYFHRVHPRSISSITVENKDIYFHHFKTLYDILIYSQRNSHSTTLLIRRYLHFLSCYSNRVDSILVYKSILNDISKLIDEHNILECIHILRNIFETKYYNDHYGLANLFKRKLLK